MARSAPPLAPPLAPRCAPVQARARQTVEHILHTAALLLAEVGAETFNTNLLAARAGLRVRTIYRYFPNKLAVITALGERMAAEWDRWFDGFELLADPQGDWRTLWEMYVDRFVRGIRAQPGGLALRRAMRAIPELREIDRRDNERLAAQVARAFSRRGVDLSRPRLRALALILVETAVAVLDLALVESPARSKALVDELKRLHRSYLEEALQPE